MVAAREFGKRGTLRPPPAGLDLLRLCQFWFPAHALPALLRPAAALGDAGADKITFNVGQAAENGNHQAPGAGAGVEPWPGQERNWALASTMRLTMLMRSKVLRRWSIRVTVTTSPGQGCRAFGEAEYPKSPQITSNQRTY